MVNRLRDAVQHRNEAQVEIAECTNAIKALAQVCGEEEAAEYLAAVDELGGKPGFKNIILTMLRAHRQGLTPAVIRSGITQTKVMDLSTYTNPLASIYTTLRRLEDAGEVESVRNDDGTRIYRLKVVTLEEVKREAARLRSVAPRLPSIATQQNQRAERSTQVTDKHYYIEQTEDGQYAVRAKGSDRASRLFSTQLEAIEHAKILNPNDHPDVERVRHTEEGGPDKWRKA